MPSVNEIYQKNFRKEDFQASPRALTIKEAKRETFKGRDNGRDEVKVVLYFLEDDRGCVLSKTRANDTAAIAGTDDYTKWAGLKIELFFDPTVRNPNGGRGGIGIRKPAPPA